MKKLLFAMLALVALASCSKDEVVQLNQDEIKFSVVAENTTKATEVFCAYNKFEDFNVYAQYINGTSKNSYIEGDKIEYKNSDWVNSTATRYWPNVGTLSFFSVVNGNMTWNAENDSPATVVDFEVNPTVASQVDLLYAAASNKTKTTTDVALNFRHALSQVVFMAKNTHPNLYVQIMGVGVHNLYSKNTLTLPASTDGNIVDHDQATTPERDSEKWGTWASFGNDADKTSDYSVTLAQGVHLYGNADKTEVQNLTNIYDTENSEEIWTNVMLLMPQTIVPWDPATTPDPDGTTTGEGEDVTTTGGTTDSFFMLKCKMYNIKDKDKAATDEGNLVQIWGGDEGKNVAIPVPAITWEQGKKYTYTFTFNTETNGGYDPDPDPDTNEPEPVLYPITLDVTIDDFTKGDGIEVTTPLATTDSGSTDGDSGDEGNGGDNA